MNNDINPFQFNAATSLPREQIIEYFIEDNNFSRFVRSNRNIFLVGERGSGKTMNLRYHSIEIQRIISRKSGKDIDLSYIGIFSSCSTPLYQKIEYQLFEDKFMQIVVSENLFVLDIARNIIKGIEMLKEYININKLDDVLNEIEYIFGIDIHDKNYFFGGLEQYFMKESVSYQKKIMSDFDIRNATSWSFYSLIVPLLEILRKIDALKNTHFMLMIDDIHYLNEHQRKLLNSLISYRDNSLFSFKVATLKTNELDMITSTGGTLLEGHDYLEIDMMQPFQNREAAFSEFAKDVIERRIKKINNTGITAEQFFPINNEFKKDIENANEKVKNNAAHEHPNWTSKQISDYVYKYGRAQYFRDRAQKSNMPPYSGFEIIKHISTGVVRNLLEPCYYMYDMVISNKHDESQIDCIPPKIQTDVIEIRSNKLWEYLKEGLECRVQGCTEKQSDAINNLFEKLCIHFKYRLLHYKSEPRAIVFTISGIDPESKKIISPLLDIAQRANLLYKRISRAKDNGLLEPYYTINRMFLPKFGLDPQGQHSRISLKAKHIIAATQGKDFPINDDDDINLEGELFNDGI